MADINWSIKHKSDTAANWTANNTILKRGQIGFETDVQPWKWKVGDGVTGWNALPYQNLGSITGTGTAGRSAIFTGSNTIGDGYLTHGGDKIKLDEDISISSPDGDRALTFGGTVNGFYIQLGHPTNGQGLYIDQVNGEINLSADGSAQKLHIDTNNIGLFHDVQAIIQAPGIELQGDVKIPSLSANKMVYLDGTKRAQTATFGINDIELIMNKGVADGYCPLDSSTKIDESYLPQSVLGATKFKGFWNATTNIITSSDLTINGGSMPAASSSNEGWYFIVSTAGTTAVDGISDWGLGDWIISIGTVWKKVDNTDALISFNGRTGAVTPQTGDYTGSQITQDSTHRFVTDTEKTTWNAKVDGSGTVDTFAKFTASGTVGDSVLKEDAANNMLYLNTASPSTTNYVLQSTSSNQTARLNATTSIQFLTSGVVRASIDNSGNVTANTSFTAGILQGGTTSGGSLTIRTTSNANQGNMTLNSALLLFQINGSERARIFNGGLSITQAAVGGVAATGLLLTAGAHTTLPAGVENFDVNINLTRTVQFSTGALTTQRAFVIQPPQYSFVGPSTITDAVTFEITGAPTAGTNATITNAYALRVSGKSKFTGIVNVVDSGCNVNIMSAISDTTRGAIYLFSSPSTTNHALKGDNTNTILNAPSNAVILGVGGVSKLTVSGSLAQFQSGVALQLCASTTSVPAIKFQSGIAPTSPNDGDIWFDGTNFYARVGGVTKTFTLV